MKATNLCLLPQAALHDASAKEYCIRFVVIASKIAKRIGGLEARVNIRKFIVDIAVNDPFGSGWLPAMVFAPSPCDVSFFEVFPRMGIENGRSGGKFA